MVLTLQTSWTNFFNGESVTLHCDIQGDSPLWVYKWYRGEKELPVDTTKATYEILSADQSDSGTYTCKGQHKERVLYTGSSNTIKVKVSARPHAVLTLETPWTGIFRTDSLTLRCEVNGSPAKWNYTWYRDGQSLLLDPSRDRLILTSANDSYNSEYSCRGNRTDRPSYTEISEGFRERNIDLKRKILVTSSFLLGIILIILGCICLRMKMKSRKSTCKTTAQSNMFFSKPPTAVGSWGLWCQKGDLGAVHQGYTTGPTGHRAACSVVVKTFQKTCTVSLTISLMYNSPLGQKLITALHFIPLSTWRRGRKYSQKKRIRKNLRHSKLTSEGKNISVGNITDGCDRKGKREDFI
ncbi:putative high affinity immunoglobulin gamma Fc receptor IC [Conger conger]|uniref:putative high affinity immunoglobulin gamma Fc receptor IC n=1 Tax=Conger conger TaxID=82655 RepID=UPI002A59A7D7|nr:putative high affinity immunoglobulin gamma Fc receptor IC [Conger conger]